MELVRLLLFSVILHGASCIISRYLHDISKLVYKCTAYIFDLGVCNRLNVVIVLVRLRLTYIYVLSYNLIRYANHSSDLNIELCQNFCGITEKDCVAVWCCCGAI